MDFDPTTEDLEEEDNVPVNTTPDDPAWWSRKSTVRLPVKVAELRWKLYQKAKQEPKFRFYALYDRICRSDVLLAAWWIVLAKNKAPGVDGVTCGDIMDGPGGAAGERTFAPHEKFYAVLTFRNATKEDVNSSGHAGLSANATI
ncbi:MAG: hypothetical protein R3C19_25730 [Planctomycetaceae bacterium]